MQSEKLQEKEKEERKSEGEGPQTRKEVRGKGTTNHGAAILPKEQSGRMALKGREKTIC